VTHQWETVSAFPPAPKTLLTQPNLLDRFLELPGISLQSGDLSFPDARSAATSSRLGEWAKSLVGDLIGPPQQVADAPLNDTGIRTAIGTGRRARSKSVTNPLNDTGRRTAIAAR
jgi:hypothetical protein